MKNKEFFERKNYFLRKPVEYQLRNLASAMEDMSNQKQFTKAVRVAYGVSAEKLREIVTEIIRDDNHSIVKLNQIESVIDSWDSINDKLINPTKNK
jgi:hypothetical protein